MITSLAALIFQSCLVKKVNNDLGTGIFHLFNVKVHNLWSIFTPVHPRDVKAIIHSLWRIAYPKVEGLNNRWNIDCKQWAHQWTKLMENFIWKRLHLISNHLFDCLRYWIYFSPLDSSSQVSWQLHMLVIMDSIFLQVIPTKSI